MLIETASRWRMTRAFAITVLLAAAGCASNQPQTSAQGSNEVIHELAGTRWVLRELDGKPVQISDGGREAYIHLDAADGRVVGHAGCNRISTTYQSNGAQISFGDVIATRMFCPDMPTETGLLQALKAAASWRIEGSKMELLDGRQATVAKFEAINL
jgi:heat shock protein HslJ